MATIESIKREEQDGFDKVIIKLSNDTYIVVGISAQELCCEEFGINFNKDTVFFVGSTVNNVRWAYGQESSQYNSGHDDSATVIIFTSVGNLAITCWNDHNGYYPHDVLAQWDETEQYDGCNEIQTI